MILEVPQEFKVNYQGIEEPFKTVGFNTSYGSGFAYKGTDKDGNLWIDDEYGPGEGLPEELKFRVPNRGFEGVAIDSNGQIYAAIQSVLNIDGKTKDKGLFTRIIKMDPKTKKVKTFAYPVNTTYKKTGDAKIGDIFSIAPDKLLVIEQGKNKDGIMTNFIYKIDLTKATDITGRTELEAITDRNELNITMATKELVVDLREHGWTTEKAEGMTVLPDGKTIVVVNDNDFGVDIYPNPSKITYNADKKEFSKDGKLMEIKNMSIVENEPLERNTELWFFTLDKKIVY